MANARARDAKTDTGPASASALPSPSSDSRLDGASLAIIAISLLLRCGAALTLPGLVHPDELFQSGEAIAATIAQPHRPGLTAWVPWEFACEAPNRAIIPPIVLAGLPAVAAQAVAGLDAPTALLLAPRLAIAVLVAVADYAIVRTLSSVGLPTLPAAALLATSWAHEVLGGRPFSNTTELVVLAAFVAVTAALRATLRRGAPPGATGCTAVPQHARRLAFASGCIAATGVFVRFSFAIFAACPALAVIVQLARFAGGSNAQHGDARPVQLADGRRADPNADDDSAAARPPVARTRNRWSRLHATALITAAGCAGLVLTSTVAVAADTAFFGGVRPDRVHWRLTPWHNFLYNSDASNLAVHGLHARSNHLVANGHIMFGPSWLPALLLAAWTLATWLLVPASWVEQRAGRDGADTAARLEPPTIESRDGHDADAAATPRSHPALASNGGGSAGMRRRRPSATPAKDRTAFLAAPAAPLLPGNSSPLSSPAVAEARIAAGTLLVGLTAVSWAPHQEPRFLFPLLLPIATLASFAWARWHVSERLQRSCRWRALAAIALAIWLIFNGSLAAIYGVFHQSGMLAALRHDYTRPDSSAVLIAASPPLLGSPPSYVLPPPVPIDAAARWLAPARRANPPTLPSWLHLQPVPLLTSRPVSWAFVGVYSVPHSLVPRWNESIGADELPPAAASPSVAPGPWYEAPWCRACLMPPTLSSAPPSPGACRSAYIASLHAEVTEYPSPADVPDDAVRLWAARAVAAGTAGRGATLRLVFPTALRGAMTAALLRGVESAAPEVTIACWRVWHHRWHVSTEHMPGSWDGVGADVVDCMPASEAVAKQ